jgi:arylformamidase
MTMNERAGPARDIDNVNERHFNVRAAVPDHLDVFRNWRLWSDDYKTASATAFLDVSYGNRPKQTLDIFYPRDDEGVLSPAVLLIHGGYWQAMDKDDISFAARGLNARGIAVICVNYSLCPEVDLSDIVEEMRLASLWLYRNAPAYHLDRDRLGVCGHSAGGHLAAMMACEDWPLRDPEVPRNLFKGCLAVSGLFDLEDLVKTTINIKVGLDIASARTLSPVHAYPNTGIPVHVVVGGDESSGFHDQSARLARAWRAAGADIALSVAENCNHFEVFERLTATDDSMCKLMQDWLDGTSD